jgi:hypothetical protein
VAGSLTCSFRGKASADLIIKTTVLIHKGVVRIIPNKENISTCKKCNEEHFLALSENSSNNGTTH